MKAFLLTIIMALGMSSPLAIAGQSMDEEQPRDAFTQNIQHIYNPATP